MAATASGGLTGEVSKIERRESEASMDGNFNESFSSLDMIRDQVAKLGRASLQRITVVGATSSGSEFEILDLFQSFHKQNQTDVEQLTGMVMTRSGVWLIILEGSANTITKLIKFVSTPTEILNPVDIRILDYNEDISEREFAFWISKSIDTKNSKESNDEKNFLEENLPKTIIGICNELYKIGRDLSQMPSYDVRVTIDELTDLYKDTFPSENTLIELATSDYILSVLDYIIFYQNTPNYGLERDAVWPVIRPINSI